MKYKEVMITKIGGPEVLKIVESELREPKIGEVRVKVEAAGIAYAEIAMRRGLYPGTPNMPFTPGYDFIGVIDKMGDKSAKFKVGNRVMGMLVSGGYSQYIYCSECELVEVPEEVDSAEAVSLVLNYVTAYQMLYRSAKVKYGDTILIHGASGGVGTALLQLGKLSNLKMYGTTPAGKKDTVIKLGGHALDYKNEDFVEYIQNDKVDAVFDAIGGENITNSLKVLKEDGKIVSFGFVGMMKGGKADTITNFINSLKEMNIPFYSISTLKKEHLNWFKEDLQKLLKLLVKSQINPIIFERISLSQIGYAHEMIEKGGVDGKFILNPNNHINNILEGI